MVLSCKNVKKSFGVNTVLDDISFSIEEGEKAAIVGANGAGKTTLFKVIIKEISADSGEVSLKRNITTGYVAQIQNFKNTVYDELLSVFGDIIKAEEEIRALEKIMTKSSAAELDGIMEKYSRLTRFFDENKGFEYLSRLRGVIKGLGFSEAESNEPISRLSGGQKTRVSLAKLLLSSPDLLLLDEPTNHLDFESVGWLEDTFLKNYSKSVLIISHDRYFLDKTVTKVIEVENGKSEIYNGNYTYYAAKKAAGREIRLKHYFDQQKEIKRQEGIIKQLKSFNRENFVKRAESREKALAKVERLDRPLEAGKIHFKLEPSIVSGNDVLNLKDVSKSFGNRTLFKNISFSIFKGSITALIGPNGVGKTTLFRIINNEISSDSGLVKLGVNVRIGYYDQEHARLNENKTIFEEISDAYPRLKNVEIRNVLAAFMFTGDDVYKTISALSGGEKGRVALAKLMLSEANFLLLDEPTNHLDASSREILERALCDYSGTVFYISHDRYFINNTANSVLELTCDGLNSYLGNYDYYVEKKSEREQQAAVIRQNPVNVSGSDYRAKKDRQSDERKRLSKINRIETEILEIDEMLHSCDVRLGTEEVYRDHVLTREILNQKSALEERQNLLYEEWANLQ